MPERFGGLFLALICSACGENSSRNPAVDCPAMESCIRQLTVMRLTHPEIRFQAASARRGAGEGSQLDAKRIELVWQAEEDQTIRLSALKFRMLDMRNMLLEHQVQIESPDFSVRADRIEMHIDEQDNYELDMVGEPVHFSRKNGDSMETGHLIYRSLTREVLFPEGLIIIGARGRIRTGPTRMNLDSGELISTAGPDTSSTGEKEEP